MAGMEGLGRIFDVIPKASGVIFKFRNASAVTFYGTNDDTFTVTVGTSHAAAATSPGNIFTHFYQNTGNGDGSAAWTKQTQAASNAVVQAADYSTVFTLYTSQIADPYDYVKCLATTADGLLIAILHDLTVQRAPANLEILNA
jgi:hypothetical protein